MRLEQLQQNDQSNRGAVNGSQLASSSHTNGSTNGFHDEEVRKRDDTPFHGHNREEVTRILLQSLSDLGYRGAAEQLSSESGYQLETPSVAAFRNAVLDGQWQEAESLLFGEESYHEHTHHSNGTSNTNGYINHGLPLADGADVHDLRFQLRKQKYLELLERRDLNQALRVLRNELTPLKRDTRQLHFMSTLMVCTSGDALRRRSSWDGARGESRSELLSEISKSISPAVMIPEHRLGTLLTTVQQGQIASCRYHNTEVQPSLYTNHKCSAEDFPLETLKELRHHSDEVWFLEFSHDGSLLASAGKDGLVNIYETTTWKVISDCREFERNPADERGICYLAFSPDDQYLIICSLVKQFLVIDVRDGLVIAKGDHFDYPVTSAAWLPDSERFVIGSQASSYPLGLYGIKSPVHNTTGIVTNNLLHSWRDPPSNLETTPQGSIEKAGQSFRITDISVSADGLYLAAATLTQKIMIYDLKSLEKVSEWSLPNRISSINYSKDHLTLLVSTNNHMTVLLDSLTGEELRRFSGAKQQEFVIRSCFGGALGTFVVSGSEDSQVLIWNVASGAEVATLDAHAPHTVSTVAWHPTNHAIFASAGDDRRVRIWSSSNAIQALREADSAGQLDSFSYS